MLKRNADVKEGLQREKEVQSIDLLIFQKPQLALKRKDVEENLKKVENTARVSIRLFKLNQRQEVKKEGLKNLNPENPNLKKTDMIFYKI